MVDKMMIFKSRCVNGINFCITGIIYELVDKRNLWWTKCYFYVKNIYRYNCKKPSIYAGLRTLCVIYVFFFNLFIEKNLIYKRVFKIKKNTRFTGNSENDIFGLKRGDAYA